MKPLFALTAIVTTVSLGATMASCQVANPPAAPPEVPLPDNVVIARRPSFPYRTWYSGNSHKSPELYPNMTMETSGRGDARKRENVGVNHLMWVYGTQISWNAGPNYWVEHAGLKRRMANPNDDFPYPFVISGYSVDEWTGSTEQKRQWVVEGLRQAKKQHPELYVAMWVAGVDSNVAALAREGVIDLIIVQAYNLTEQRGIGVSQQTGFDRMDVAKKYGLENKTIFGFGHVTDAANWKGGFVWTEEIVRSRMAELKKKYPKMPGVAFFEAKHKNLESHSKVVQMFDRLSAEFWPDSLPLDGVFSLTPQNATKNRLRLPQGKAVVGAQASVGESVLDTAQLLKFVPLGQGRYKIQAPYAPSLVLTASGTKVILQKNNDSNSQNWKLTNVVGGYTLAPESTPQLRLTVSKLGDSMAAHLVPATQKPEQVWALAPEYLPPPSGTTIITTADGRGADSVVMPNGKRGRETNIGVSNSTDVAKVRKGYIRFDLSQAKEAKEQWKQAKLSLTLSRVSNNSPANQNWTFKVYGLKDGSTGEDWRSNEIDWATAPANDVNSNNLTADAIPLGAFNITGKGNSGKTIPFSSPQLLDFLKADTNGFATLIIVRETAENQGETDNVLHEFASREHTTIPSPTLTITSSAAN